MSRVRASPWILAASILNLHRGAGAAGRGGSRPPPPFVEATVWLPAELHGTFLGRAAAFSTLPLPSGTLRAWSPRADPTGCGAYDLPASGDARVVVVRQGGCDFLRKTLQAQTAGAAGVVVVSREGLLLMTAEDETSREAGAKIFALSVQASAGEQILRQLGRGTLVTMSFRVYKSHTRGISLAVLIGGATVLVVLGAYFSTADLRRRVVVTTVSRPAPGPLAVEPLQRPGPPGPAPADGGVLQVVDGLIFCVVGSCMLVAMYFFMQYMIYAVIGVFCLVGFFSLTLIGSWLLQQAVPSLGRPASLALLSPLVVWADLLVAPLALAVVLCWLRLQGSDWGWALQDAIGFGFLMLVQQALQLPNLKNATVILGVMFFFDIFWVLISPLLFHQSVMVKVATSPVHGLKVPMLLRVPSFTDPFGRDRMIGFGDIAAPGLLVSYLLRWDLWNKRGLLDGYFFFSVVGYFVGLCATIAAVLITHQGQPALLYLVPGTLGLTLLLGPCRGDLASLWRGLPQEYHACCQDERGPPFHVVHGHAPAPQFVEVQRVHQP